MRHKTTYLLLVICLAILPVCVMSCSYYGNTPAFSADDLTNTPISFRPAGGFPFLYDNAFAFIYNDDASRKLDSWQEVSLKDDRITLASGSGGKLAVMVVNYFFTQFMTYNVGSFDSINSLLVPYSLQDPKLPTCCGVLHYNTLKPGLNYMEISPLMARVEIREFKVDFSGTGYSSSRLENARVYLTNLNGLCPLGGNPDYAREIINQGYYDYNVCSKLAHPEMTISEDVKGAVLYCFPNNADTVWDGAEQISFATKLVIEGTIDGTTYYYPIRIGDSHVQKGANYVYDITLKRKGCLDPDGELDQHTAQINLIYNPWTEKENADEIF